MKNFILDIVQDNRLSHTEELEIFRQMAESKNVDEKVKLRNKIVLANLGLVVSSCKRFFGYQGLNIDDMIGEGILGLQVAIDKFDINRNCNFCTYAFWWIKQKVRRYIEAQHMDKVNSNAMSLDGTFTEDSDSKSFIEMVIQSEENEATKNLEHIDNAKILAKAIAEKLTNREKFILNARYNVNRKKKTFEEVAILLAEYEHSENALSKMTIFKIEQDIMHKLKSYLKKYGIRKLDDLILTNTQRIAGILNISPQTTNVEVFVNQEI